jgi:hypothetical protein
MFKVFGFLTKREGVEMQDFIDYYEYKHVPLICSLAPTPIVYKRRYLVRGEELTKEGAAVDFDVMTELRFPDRAAFLAWMAQLSRIRRSRPGRSGRGEVSRLVADQGLYRRGIRDVRVSYAARGPSAPSMKTLSEAARRSR